MKAVVGAFNQEKALVGAFSVIVQLVVEPMDRFAALVMKHGSAVTGPDNKLNLYRWRGGGSLQSSNGHFIIHVLCSQWVTCGPVVPTPCHPDMDQACLSHVPKLFIIKEILADN